jgi:hypothetical protein
MAKSDITQSHALFLQQPLATHRNGVQQPAAQHRAQQRVHEAAREHGTGGEQPDRDPGERDAVRMIW